MEFIFCCEVGRPSQSISVLKNTLGSGGLKNTSGSAIHLPLIDLDTFLKVQEVFKNKRWKGLKTSQKVYDFPLRQFLTCDICGDNITGSYSRGRNERYGYYHCRGKCQTRVRKEKVETRISDLLTTIQINANIKESFIDVMRDVVKESNCFKTVDLGKKKDKRKQILELLENADDMRLSNQLPADRYTSIVDRYTSELRRLELEIEALELNNENVNDYLEAGLSLIENLSNMFNETDNEGKKMLIGSLFTDKLILGNDGCRTSNLNEVINVLTRNSKGLEGIKNGKAVKNDSLSVKVPVTDQFSNYFYQNIEEIYALKEILIGEGIDLNTSLRHSNTGMQANSVLPLWN